MRNFVLICCLISYAAAASLGYDYEHNTAASSIGGGSVSSGSDLLSGSSPAVSHVAPAEFSKEFFSYSAPEQEFNEGASSNQLSSSLKQNLRVIFIKGPESSGVEHAALQLAKSATDDRTAIYVLNKQADISDLANKLQQLNHNSAKPEVHFVKYRTHADAENAKRTIQSQYESLHGPSSSHNGGVAPVLNFASQAPAGGVGGIGGLGGEASLGAGNNGYLPPGRRF